MDSLRIKPGKEQDVSPFSPQGKISLQMIKDDRGSMVCGRLFFKCQAQMKIHFNCLYVCWQSEGAIYIYLHLHDESKQAICHKALLKNYTITNTDFELKDLNLFQRRLFNPQINIWNRIPDFNKDSVNPPP